MQVLVVTHYFPPEIGAPQARLSELAAHWVQGGCDVTVLTAMPNHPTGVVPPEYRGAWRRDERIDGYRVVRTWLYATPNVGVVKKTLGHLSFMITSVILGLSRVGHPDVVVVSSPTFFSILSAWLIARVKRARLIIEVRDLWPAIFVELGVLKNRVVIRALEAVELAAYRSSDAVVVVTEGFQRNIVDRGIDPSKVHTIRNGVDLSLFSPDLRVDPDMREWLCAGPEQVLVLYIGAHGISHGLHSVVEAAACLADEPVHLALVGEGAEKRELEEEVNERGLTNVTMHPGVSREQVPSILAAADICLVPLKDVPLFRTFIPSKIFEYLASGKAVVGAVRGEPAEILSEAGAVVVRPEAVEDLVRAIMHLANDPERRAEMGRRGRRYVEEHFDRRQLAADYLDILKAAVHEHTALQ
ncbi:MAG: glycosyltransferase family 4 protein [Actinobacteria bacterium]|nr:glycosyltransferase family 4 protein [Actinomycetota bacterium]